MKRTVLLIVTITLISSCAPKPVVVDVTNEKDPYLSCNQLNAAIRSAERFKIEARSEDRFKLRYIFIPTTMLATYRFHAAESAAKKRIQHLNKFVDQRECNADEQEVRQRIINPQILNYPAKESFVKKNNDYNFYQYSNGQPNYAPPVSAQEYGSNTYNPQLPIPSANYYKNKYYGQEQF